MVSLPSAHLDLCYISYPTLHLGVRLICRHTCVTVTSSSLVMCETATCTKLILFPPHIERSMTSPETCVNCTPTPLGACLSSRWHFRSESDSVLLHEQAFPPLEDRPGAASAAERAGLRAEGPSVAFHRGAGPGEPGPG